MNKNNLWSFASDLREKAEGLEAYISDTEEDNLSKEEIAKYYLTEIEECMQGIEDLVCLERD